LHDYEEIIVVGDRLKVDNTVTVKLRKKLQKLTNRMKDYRNFENMIAYNIFLKEVAEYQKWGQLERASAFERKHQMKKLRIQIENLKRIESIKILSKKGLDMIDFQNKCLKNSKIKLSYFSNTTRARAEKSIAEKVSMFCQDFLDEKQKLHTKEDPAFLDELSDIFDMRNWKTENFEPLNNCENDKKQKKELRSMLKKLENGESFYKDLNADDCLLQFANFVQEIYEAEKEEKKFLNRASTQKHLVDQWKFYFDRIPQNELHKYNKLQLLIQRAGMSPNGQTGCERANSDYNLFKTELSASMKLPMITARLRVKVNGPPLSLFNPKPIRQYWIGNKRQLAQTVTERKLVIERIRKDEQSAYTSKIFN